MSATICVDNQRHPELLPHRSVLDVDEINHALAAWLEARA